MSAAEQLDQNEKEIRNPRRRARSGSDLEAIRTFVRAPGRAELAVISMEAVPVWDPGGRSCLQSADTGRGSRRQIERARPRPLGLSPKAQGFPVPRGPDFDAAACRIQARDALVGLGWKRSIATAAVDDAISALGPASPLDTLIREALRRCPRPSS